MKIDPICGCEITKEDRAHDLANLRADLAKLKRLRFEHPRKYAENLENYEAWRLVLVAAIEGEEKDK